MLLYVFDLALKLVAFAWFSYARQHFAVGGKVPLGMRAVQLIYLAGLGINVSLSIVLKEYLQLFSALGAITTVVSVIIFYYAVQASKMARLHVAFSESTGSSLVSSGIYRYVRHPFYLSYLVYWFSWCLSLGFHAAPSVVFLVLLALYILSIRLEEQELERNFGEEYREYKERTSLLLPYLI